MIGDLIVIYFESSLTGATGSTIKGTAAVTTRGFILINENEELLRKIEKRAASVIKKSLAEENIAYNDIKFNITKEISLFIKKETGRKPLVMPIIMNIKKQEV
jgi:ribonuclease J